MNRECDIEDCGERKRKRFLTRVRLESGILYLDEKEEWFISAINQLSMHAMPRNGSICIRYA